MFRKFGDLLHRTPWWALVLMGFFTLLLLGLFTTPYNVIRLADQGQTKEERRAIKREIDTAFVSGTLNVAERVVSEMRARATDPARQAELDSALQEIANSRRELDRELSANAGASTASVRSAAREAANAAREAARSAAESAVEAATEKMHKLEEARNEIRAAHEKAGISDASALAALEKEINKARSDKDNATAALARIEKSFSEADASLNTRDISIGFKNGFGDGPAGKRSKESATAVAPAAPSAPAAPAAPPAKAAPAAPAAPPATPSAADMEEGFNIDVNIGDRKVKTETIVDERGHKTKVVRVSGEELDPLSAERRQEIRDKVAKDVRRVGIGSALILLFIPLFIIVLIAKVFVGRARRAVAFAEVKKKEAESANVNRQIVEAKLQALQAQVEPHFLYNTLANVQALTEIDPAQANQMTGHLINYLRAALPKMREGTSTVGQEVELVRAYLNILKMRMGERLAFDIDIPADLLNLPFPPLMLPSLVENAIKHGLEPKREGGRIDVMARREGNSLTFIVRDSGRGLTGAPVQAGGGVGLSNLRERLQTLFGEAGKLTLESNEPSGVVASITVPADGSSVLSSAAPDTAPAVPQPTGFWPRLRAAVGRGHSAWSRVMSWVLVALLIAILITFVGAVIGLLTGNLPLSFGHAELGGMEGKALGTVLLTIAFSVLALAAVIVWALIYGLGYFFAGLLIVIPIIILVSIFPAVAPFVLVGAIVYWAMKRKKNRD